MGTALKLIPKSYQRMIVMFSQLIDIIGIQPTQNVQYAKIPIRLIQQIIQLIIQIMSMLVQF